MPQETVIRIQTTPPGFDDLFRLESEPQFRARIEAEAARAKEKLQVPTASVAAGVAMQRQRGWPPLAGYVEPDRVCHGRLFFEQPSSERYGRQVGALQPFVSAGLFYADLAVLPVRWPLDHPCSFMQCDDHRDLRGARRPGCD